MTLVEIGMILIAIGIANLVAIYLICSVAEFYEVKQECRSAENGSFARGSAGQS